jgi:hypothetical protein
MENISLSFNNHWLWLAAAGFLIYLFLVILLYRKTNPPLARNIRALLGIMRYIALFAALICLAEPVFSIEFEKKDDPIIVFLADNSSSIRTVENIEAKQEFLERFYAGTYDNLMPAEARIDKYLFADSYRQDRSLSYDGQQTALGQTILDVAELYKDQNLSAIVIASDGLSNYGPDPVSAAKETGVPVYTIDLGPQKISRDLRIVNVTHNPVAYADRPFEIEVELEGRGFDKLELPLAARSGGKELARKNIQVLGQGQRQRFTVEVTPKNPGIQNFNISLPVQPDEELDDNNSRNFSLKVLKSKKRILVAAQKLNWELTFLKRVISASPDFEIDLVLFERGQRLSTTTFPSSPDSINLYDLVIMVNCKNQSLMPHLGLLDSYVYDHGGSLWFILGENSMGKIVTSETERIWPYKPGLADRYYNDFPFHISLTEEGKLHPITRLIESSRENISLWKNIPPFEEHLTLAEVGPGSRILAVHPEKEYHGGRIPLIFINNMGGGKTLTFAMGPMWKIGFLNSDFGEDDFAYRQLLTNAVNWLTTKEDVERIRLAANQTIYKSGERVELNATVLDDNYNPLENSVVNAVIKAEGRSDSLIVSLVQDSPGSFSADLGLLPSGDYTIKGSVVWEDKILKEIKAGFRVESFSLEEETLFLPPDMLAKVSRASGGKYYTTTDFENIARDLTAAAMFRSESKETRLAHNFWVLVIILTLLSIEWLVRKRLQLL